MKNSAFMFIKPDAVTDKVKELVEKTLKEKGLKIVKKGNLKSEVIDKKKLIDNHYYAIASKATILKPKDLNVPADKFKGKFGLEWQAALDSGKVYNAMDGCEFFGIDADEMDKQWAVCKKADKLIKFGGGFYCGDMTIGEKQAYVFNGFFMSMRASYVIPGKSIYYYVVEWDAKKTSWADFRSGVCGATDPATADAGSLRGLIYAKWEELELKAQPNVGLNALHASASPFEALAEKMNWLNFKIEQDAFGEGLLNLGVPPKVVKDWCKDPQVEVEAGKKGSCYDALEDIDASDCLDKCGDLWMLNRPPVTGRNSGETYDFGNIFAKIIAGKEPCYKVFENNFVMAFLDKKPTSKGEVVVIPKATGFPTFLDMPSSKAAELTRELPRLANALKTAMEASDMTICSHHGASKATVAHPKFHLIPVYNGAYTSATVTEDSAKELLAKIDAALHPPKPLKKAKFTKVGSINPDGKGLNLCVKVLGEGTAKELPKGGKVYEFQLGDASGKVTISMLESQKDMLVKDKSYEIRNASVKMVKGHIAIIVDKWAKIEAAEEAPETIGEKDISEVEYELVKGK
eukprot:TRINITY_DN1198_c0_g1_i4.p1 TRINITY_DN1198_c0_g1~~TRINITY_DN1198_c0_g1_i4.p1  ORF type:complete len:574 (-),score=231.09 TRINITY_DN1198_c0_g1_i4:222-1943(-)